MVKIDNIEYQVNPNEFKRIHHKEYNNLFLYNDLAELERISGLIKELQIELNLKTIYFFKVTHGGFLPIQCSKFFRNNYVITWENDHSTNLIENLKNQNITNIQIADNCGIPNKLDLLIDFEGILTEDMFINNPIVISNKKQDFGFNLKLWTSNYFLTIPNEIKERFIEGFKYYMNDDILDFDNLINLCIMVKNAGCQFKSMLEHNLPLIDKWTILDTGSTDETIDIIKSVLIGKKKGRLYQEPFINFRDSRNRLLELAGEECKYTLMLDDTYKMMNNLRDFLNEIRSDQFADSYTLFIRSNDTEYGSNRILKSNRKLKYINRIHEVISDKNNINVVVPINRAFIFDERFDFMEKRTMDRKILDLKLLYEELEENPNNSRTHYYLAQTYNLLEDYENVYKWFKARVEHPNDGFIQEKVDAAFELARCANFKLNKPWEECEKLYLQAYKLDQTRPESLYFIGIHYFLENNYALAYEYLKKAFRIGYPAHCQYSLKPTLSFHFCPRYLAKVCYNYDFKLGEEAAFFFLKHNKPDSDGYEELVSWYHIYRNLNILNELKPYIKLEKNRMEKPIICFIVDGGFKPWNGSSINKEGVGGSETWAIEIARNIAKTKKYHVYLFCKCSKEEVFEGVNFMELKKVYGFLKQIEIEHCIISRFSEYIPMTYHSNCKNVHFIMHDLGPTGIVIPLNSKLKNIFCLTEWHRRYFLERFPMCAGLTKVLNYGIDQNKFLDFSVEKPIEKTKYNFIYSSTANRGLLPLLQMWPKIHRIQSKVTLDIYCDLENSWVNNVAKDQVIQIKKLLNDYKDMGITYHGWVDKQMLANGWKRADFWFYPCIFQETFCLTALEAALSRTFVITNGLAALEDTVGNRGICLPGNPMDINWQNKAMETIGKYLGKNEEKERLIEENYKWAKSLTWEGQTNILLSLLC